MRESHERQNPGAHERGLRNSRGGVCHIETRTFSESASGNFRGFLLCFFEVEHRAGEDRPQGRPRMGVSKRTQGPSRTLDTWGDSPPSSLLVGVLCWEFEKLM